MKIRIKNKMSQVVDMWEAISADGSWQSDQCRANITVCCQKPGTPLLNHASAQIICNLTETEDIRHAF